MFQVLGEGKTFVSSKSPCETRRGGQQTKRGEDTCPDQRCYNSSSGSFGFGCNIEDLYNRVFRGCVQNRHNIPDAEQNRDRNRECKNTADEK